MSHKTVQELEQAVFAGEEVSVEAFAAAKAREAAAKHLSSVQAQKAAADQAVIDREAADAAYEALRKEVEIFAKDRSREEAVERLKDALFGVRSAYEDYDRRAIELGGRCSDVQKMPQSDHLPIRHFSGSGEWSLGERGEAAFMPSPSEAWNMVINNTLADARYLAFDRSRIIPED